LEADLTLEVGPSVFFSSPGLADILPDVLVVVAPVPVLYLERRLEVAFASSPAAPATDLRPAVSLEVAATPALAPPVDNLEVLVGVFLLFSAFFAFSSS
jgi:hypothetical protein